MKRFCHHESSMRLNPLPSDQFEFPNHIRLKPQVKIENLPNNVVKLSAASKNSLVPIALSPFLSTGTSTKLRFMVSKKVCPGGYCDLTCAMAYTLDSEVCRVVYMEEFENWRALERCKHCARGLFEGDEVCRAEKLVRFRQWWRCGVVVLDFRLTANTSCDLLLRAYFLSVSEGESRNIDLGSMHFIPGV